MRKVFMQNYGFAYVDEEDYERVMECEWSRHDNGHGLTPCIRRDGRPYAMARYILGPGLAGHLYVHHMNGNRMDNRKSNLRVITSQQYQASLPSKASTSGFRGVSWAMTRQTWRAFIRFGRKQYHLGTYRTKIEAAEEYDLAARFFFGDFALVNFPDKDYGDREPSLSKMPRKSRRAASLYHGVCWASREGKWRAEVRVNGRQQYVGMFTSPDGAAWSHDLIAKELLGDKATLNFPDLFK